MSRSNEMTKSEIPLTNECRISNDEKRVWISSLVILLSFVISHSSFAQAPERTKAGGAGTGQERVVVDDKTEQVIRGALKYLASRQNSNGSWTASDGERQEVAMTGYVLITFLSCGHLPDEGEHGKTVTAGVNYLLNNVRPDGTFQPIGHYMYGHGVASIALAEVYGQTKDPRVRPKLEQVIRTIIESQNAEGGWRYNPRPNDADISVSVLQVVALRAAKNAGLDIPQVTIDRAVKYVHSCYDRREGGFTYQPGNRRPGYARTAAAIYSLQVCGQYDDPQVATGADFLFQNRQEREWFTYGNFYAAPALYMIGGETWKKWYGQMSGILIKSVSSKGDEYYWEKSKLDQGRPVGEVYCTAVYTMILAMPYHYIPLYQR